MIPAWPEGTKTEVTKYQNKDWTVPLIQLNTGKPLPKASFVDLDVCMNWTTIQASLATGEDKNWWNAYLRVVTRFRNLAKPSAGSLTPWLNTKEGVLKEWNRRVAALEKEQASARDKAIENGVHPRMAWANYNQIVNINKAAIDRAFDAYAKAAK